MPQQKTIQKAAPKAPTGAAAYRQIADQGTLWTAPSGAVVRVRDLTIADRALVLQLPQALQEVVAEIIEQSPSLQGSSDDEAQEAMLDILGGERHSMNTVLEREYELGVHFCVRCWIDPEVVMTPDEITDPERQIHAGEIQDIDRRAFMSRVFGGDAVEAAALATFRPGSAGGVGAGSDGPAVRADAGPPSGA